MSKKYTTNFLEDTNGSTGTTNQVLVSTATGVDWVDGSGSGIIGGPYLPLTAGASYPLTGDLYVDGTISVGGSPIASFSGNYNRISRPNGTVGIYLGNANDAGNYYDNTTHYFRSSGGSSTYAIINYLGNVGIGTTSPSRKLHVNGDVQVDTNLVVNSGIYNTTYYAGSSTATYFKNSVASDTLTILESGNVGIGTTSPTGAKLVVNGITKLGTSTEGLIIDPSVGGGVLSIKGIDIGGAGYNPIHIQAGATTGMYFDTSGNVGIGTITPRSALDVTGTTGLTWNAATLDSSGLVTIGTRGTGGSLFINTPSINTDWSAGLGVDGSYSSNISTVNIKAFGPKLASGALQGSNLTFSTTYETTLSERMRIDRNGNVGIGTPSPVSTWLSGFDPSTGNGTFKLTSEGWIVTPYLTGLAGYYPGQGARPIVWADHSGTNLQCWDNSATDGISLRSSNGTTRLFVKEDGNVGIGTTSPGAKLSLYNATEDVSINVNTGTGGSYPKKTGISFGATSTSLGGDAEFTGGAGIQAINTAVSNNLTDLTFWTTAGGSPAEKMRITSAGGISFGSTGTAYGTSGQVLTSAGNASPTWATPTTGDITAIIAGDGMTGTSLSGPIPTLNVVGVDGIIANANDIQVDSTVVRTTGNQTIGGTKTFSSAIAAPSGNSTEWNTAYTDRNKWDGGATGLTASTGRASLGGTTLGENMFILTNPSAITFPRFNANNTVSALSASDFRTAIGAGTGGGDVSGSGAATRVAFWNGTNSLTSDVNLYWDNTNDRLGIGTTSPQSDLDVEGIIRSSTSSTEYGMMYYNSGELQFYSRNGASKGDFEFIVTSGSSSTSAMRIWGTGNVGQMQLPQYGGGTITGTATKMLAVTTAGLIVEETLPTSSGGTVTSVSGTGTVSGLTLTGTVTSSGNLTLGGTLALTSGNITTGLGFTPYNATNPAGYTANTGTVTSVAATPGSGISISGSPITTSGTLTITNTDKGSGQAIFKNVAVSGQTTVVADTNNDTLTLATETGLKLLTNASTDTITYSPQMTVMVTSHMDHSTNNSASWYYLPFVGEVESTGTSLASSFVTPFAGYIRSITYSGAGNGSATSATTIKYQILNNGTVVYGPTSALSLGIGTSSGKNLQTSLSSSNATFTAGQRMSIQIQVPSPLYRAMFSIILQEN